MPAIDAMAIISDDEKVFKMIRHFDVSKRGGIIISELEAGFEPTQPIKEYIWRQILPCEEGTDIYALQIGQDQLKEMLLDLFAADKI